MSYASNTPPHSFITVTHCERCYLQNTYPGDYDSVGNPIPATAYIPSPQPVITGQQALDALGNLYVPLSAKFSQAQQDLITRMMQEHQLPDLPQEPPVQAPAFIGPRGTYKVEKLGWDWRNDPDTEKGYYEPAKYADANLVGSKTDLEEDGHLPCIDLDLPAHLEPSTKPDHYHLYLNKVVKWDKYVNLLNALYECGLINEGFKEMSIRRGQTFVRRPGVYKQPGEGDS